MNEKIKLLAEQAGDYYRTTKLGADTYPAPVVDTAIPAELLEKFAELIVRQCIFEMMHESTLQDNTKIQDFSVAVANRVEKHFGIDK